MGNRQKGSRWQVVVSHCTLSRQVASQPPVKVTELCCTHGGVSVPEALSELSGLWQVVVSHHTLSRRVAGQPPVKVTELCAAPTVRRTFEEGK